MTKHGTLVRIRITCKLADSRFKSHFSLTDFTEFPNPIAFDKMADAGGVPPPKKNGCWEWLDMMER